MVWLACAHEAVSTRWDLAAFRAARSCGGSWQDAEATCWWRVVPVALQDGRRYVAAMIIWRGWGILSIFITLLIAGIVGATFQAFLGSGNASIFFGYGLGLILAGVANYLFGRQVNELAPAKKVEAFKEQMRREMWDRVAHGAFQVGPGAPPPANREEAHQQVEHVVEQASANAARGLRNIHTLFFIPVQWIGAVEGVLGVVLIVLSVVMFFSG